MTWLDNATDTHQTQGSPAWLAWRKKHIGASEVSAILGESDFSNPYKVWQEKTNRVEGFKGNWATQRGSDAEPLIRRRYEEMHGLRLETPVMEYHSWPILSASLDGYNHEFGLVVEFKYPSQAKHEMAIKGEVPKTYAAQLQVQMMVASCDTAHYVSWNGREIAVVVVKANPTEQARILRACQEFWKFVETDAPPPGAPVVLESDTLAPLAKRYKQLLVIERQTAEEIKFLRSRFTDLIAEPKARFFGLSFTRSTRRGAIDYGKMPELAGVDIEAYRKPDTETITIREVGDAEGGNEGNDKV